MEAGDALIKVHDQLNHGAWMSWVAEHCEISDRTVRVYVQLAEHRELIEARIKATTDEASPTKLAERCQFSINRALRWIKEDAQQSSVLFIEDATPEQLFTKLVSSWPPGKIIQLAELITTQFPSEANEQPPAK
jgi:hypothetical protein